MRILLDGTLESASDDHRNAPAPQRTLSGVRGRLHHRRVRRLALIGLLAALAGGVGWLRPGLDWNAPRADDPLALASHASPYPSVLDDLDFASDGSFAIPLAVVRSRCGMTVDEHVRPVASDSGWDAATIPGGSDLTIQDDAGFTRHCLVGYNLAAGTSFVDWGTLDPVTAAQECAEQVGLDLAGWGRPNAALLTTPNDFSAPSVVVALRRAPDLLAVCHLVEDLPRARLMVTRLAEDRQSLCTGVSLHLTTSDNLHPIADAVVAWGVAPVRDRSGRVLEEGAFLTFSGPGLPSLAVQVVDGIVVANASWPLPAARTLADRHPASRLVTDYAVTVIDVDGRTLASEDCGR